jgi:acetyl-CoA synthetase
VTGRSLFGTGEEAASRYNAGLAAADVIADALPDRPAVIYECSRGTSTLSFGELAAQSSVLAASLERCGIGMQDTVGVFAPASIAAVVAHVAVLKCGAVTVPLVPMLGDDVLAHRAVDAKLSALLIDPALAERAAALVQAHRPDLAVIGIDLERLAAAAPTAPCPAAAMQTLPDDPALILYTSGTTGRSKGASLPQRVLLARHVPLSMIHGPLQPDDVFWTPADWIWVGSLVDSVLAPLTMGCTVMTYERRRFDPVAAVERIKRHKVTRAFLPPTALRQLMSVGAAAWEGHSLRSIHSGGEKLTADALQWARETLGVVVDEIYGLTEASFLAGSAHRFYPAAPESLGRPYPGQTLRVARDDGTNAAPGEVGELMVPCASPTLFLGYYGKPELTAARFRDGWFGTGDLMRYDEDGRLYYLGRKDDLIMSSGHRIGPGEIEDVLRTHVQVLDAVVVGEQDSERGQLIKAVIQLQQNGNGTGEHGQLTVELQDLVRARIGRHAYPRRVEYVEDYPRTVTGKVRRDLLRLPAAPR